MAYNFREKQSAILSERLPICPAICVGRNTTLPKPLLNWTTLCLILDQSTNGQRNCILSLNHSASN